MGMSTHRKESPDPGINEERAKNMFSLWKVMLPVIIGITVVGLMFLNDSRKNDLSDVFSEINFDSRVAVGFVLVMLAVIGRDFGLSWRFRTLTDRELSWGKSLKVTMLCEFTSCVTPSAVGGSSLGMVFLNSQGVEFGRATTLMLTTVFLDELFFVLICPLIVVMTPAGELFSSIGMTFTHGLMFTFWSIYALIVVWTGVLFVGIILYPHWMRRLLIGVCRLPFLRKFKSRAEELGVNMIATSQSLKQKTPGYWVRAFGSTFVSWVSRFAVVNALFLALVPTADLHQWLIFAKEFVIWVILMVSPTPGGAGLSEWLFSEYYGDMVSTGAVALLLAVLWRVVSYYIYLIIGCCIVPSWIKRYYHKLNSDKRG